MRNLSRISLVVAVSAALVGSVALPATAADTGITVTVQGGGLAINAPGAAALGSIAPGANANVTLTGVAVTDTRAGTLGWQAQVIMTALTVSGQTIPASAATYTAAAATVNGTATVTPAAPVADLTTAKTVQTATAVSGNNDATWNATLNIAVPAGALAGDYTATLTHSTI